MIVILQPTTSSIS